ncbi:hypothetical protein D3C78_1578360 [compost metagenome]
MAVHIKCPGKTDGAGGYTVLIVWPEQPGGRHCDIGIGVVQGAEGHLLGDFAAGEIEGIDGVWADTEQALLGFRGIHHIAAFDQ